MKRAIFVLLAIISTTAFGRHYRFYAYKIELASERVVAVAINESGQIVGHYFDSDGTSRAFFTGVNGVGAKTIDLPGGASGEATGITKRGIVVGNFVPLDVNTQQPFIYREDEGARKLFNAYAPEGGRAVGINNNNQIVGYSYESRQPGDGYIYHSYIADMSGNVLNEFPDLPESFQVTSINNTGQVTGTVRFKSAGSYRPVVTGPDGIGWSYIGKTQGTGYSINDDGDVAGFGLLPARTAFSTKNGTDKIDYKESDIYRATEAHAIGPRGASGGSMVFHSGEVRAFIAQPKQTLLDLNKRIVNRSKPYVKFVRVNAINSSLKAAVEAEDGSSYIICPRKDCL